MESSNPENFVTVVSVGSAEESSQMTLSKFDNEIDTSSSGYVTVLTIDSNENSCILKNVIEEVLVYRLPGERLGFGLKFEGGTKSNEFVKRLFIQSCAPDSPASRVQSSWGNLSEGDEVLKIDSIPVNNMTRMDCVRSLKDSNVVIKLLVRHFYNKTFNNNNNNEMKTRSIEDLPQVISAEKKRSPPPPPPVPPRKIPRKFYKTNNTSKDNQETNNKINKSKRLQSPRNSTRLSHSPEIPRRTKKYSETGPPDAEVYTDLFSQESRQSLSESDDTGSSISTVVERFNSFPSSISGSLPSTPTSVQKHLDLSNLLNSYDDEEISSALIYISNNSNEKTDNKLSNNSTNDDNVPLQQPSSFQDAPLSYGNENIRIFKTKNYQTTNNSSTENGDDSNVIKPIHDENMNISSLPRLVDFVPKYLTTSNGDISENSFETIKLFLEYERRESSYSDDNSPSIYEIYDKNDSKISSSSLLSTIGEVEEENNHEMHLSRSPITTCIESDKNYEPSMNEGNIEDDPNNMETLPTDSRQPPDGHEFPDYDETNSETIHKNYETSFNKEKNIIKNSNNQKEQAMKTYKSIEYINLSQNKNSLNSEFTINKPSIITMNKTNSLSNNDLNSIYNINDKFNSKDDITFGRTEVEVTLHTRSQSLIDMSRLSKQKNDRWNLLAEQRRKGLSKLKGLVIPENLNENELYTPVNLPEIVSQTTPSLILDKIDNNLKHQRENYSKEINQINLPLTSPPWDMTSNSIPKYSPAFKRKSLQIYPSVNTEKYREKSNNKDIVDKKLSNKNSKLLTEKFQKISNKNSTNNKKENLIDLRKCEGESDDDSGASSNQSSYLSKYSPPPSPNSSCDIIDYQSNNDERYNSLHGRLLKPTSVEAINRKNILASAKCRSGRDLKVGSPVIHRKCTENDNNSTNIYNASIISAQNHTEEESIEYKNNKNDSVIENKTKTTEKPKLDVGGMNLATEKLKKISLNSSNENKIKDKEITQNIKPYYRSQPVKPLSVSNLRKSFEKADSIIPMPLVSINKTIKKKFEEKIDVKTKFNNENSIKKQTIKKKEETPVKEKKLENNSNNENIIIQKNGVNTKTVVLCPKTPGDNVGINLKGGEDSEIKDIIVHRIRYGSVAYENGNLKKGDKILSINGKSTEGITYAESLEMLKQPLSKFVLVVEESYEENVEQSSRRKTFNTSNNCEKDSLENSLPLKNITHTISLIKEENIGLGFSIEGGKDSLQGDVPLRIKKIFTGGVADKNGELNVGDELLAINDKNYNNLSKIEAWTLMKKLPDGDVKIQIHR